MLSHELQSSRLYSPFIDFSNHGRVGLQSSKSHWISVDDGYFDLDSLIPLSQLAEKNKVSLLIVDGSCRSGLSLNLANSKTCVITTSGKQAVWWITPFVSEMLSSSGPRKDLESVYLAKRRLVPYADTPRISTKADQAASRLTDSVAQLNELFDVKGFLPNHLNPKKGFDRKKHFRQLLEWQNMQGVIPDQALHELRRFHNLIDSLEERLNLYQYYRQEMRTKKICKVLSSGEKFCEEIRYLASEISRLSKSLSVGSPEIRKLTEEKISFLSSVMQSSQYKEYASVYTLDGVRTFFAPILKEMHTLERILYHSFYNYEMTFSDHTANPCAGIELF